MKRNETKTDTSLNYVKMKLLNRIKEKGISLRVTHILMSAVIIVVTLVLFALTFFAASAYRELSKATDYHIAMQENAEALMNASDYLTQEAQCYTITCEIKHLDNYFTEANITKRREKSIEVMSEMSGSSAALHELENAMSESVSLMDREYYAMLLVLEATDTEYRPSELAELTLTPEDAALSPDKKMELARNMMHDRAYYEQKSAIRMDMESCLKNLDKEINEEQRFTEREMKSSLHRIWIIGFIQMVIILFGLLLNKLLGTDPLVKSVQKIKDDKSLTVSGATEFRYLARAYNKMHQAMKDDIAMLNFRVSHDKLTGVYNRAGYEIISTSVDLKTTTMILVDVDNFKSINDNYSHPVGDKVLQKLSKILTDTFRSDDFVCRIGGDEFVVFLLKTNAASKKVVMDKIDSINKKLSDTSDGLPPISISAGCVLGDEDTDAKRMLKEADVALYRVKDRGKKGCCYYN